MLSYDTRKDFILTHDSATDSLGVRDRLELEAVLEALDAVRVARGSDRDDQFVIWLVSVPMLSSSWAPRSGKALTRDIAPHRSLSLVARHLYLHQALGHIQIHRRAHEEMPSHTGDELSQRFDERPHLDGPDACGGEERGKGKVGLRRDESDVVCCWWEGLDQSDSLQRT